MPLDETYIMFFWTDNSNAYKNVVTVVTSTIPRGSLESNVGKPENAFLQTALRSEDYSEAWTFSLNSLNIILAVRSPTFFFIWKW